MNETSARYITLDEITQYVAHLQDAEKSEATIRKYTHDLMVVMEFLAGRELTRAMLLDWKNSLAQSYKATSANTMLVSLNSFLTFKNWDDLRIRPFPVPKTVFRDESRELTREEYERLVRTADRQGNGRLSLIMRTICSTGIRVSELQFITVEAIKAGKAEIINKSKCRIIFLPKVLQKELFKYIRTQKITKGVIFITKNRKPINRSNIWRDMKKLCKAAGVALSKVFPHNLRRLFAVVHYSAKKDLSRLADILGHSNVNTTRIYTMESGTIHAQQIDQLGLAVVT